MIDMPSMLRMEDVVAAGGRIAADIRPVTLLLADADTVAPSAAVLFAAEFLQHTGSFKARGAANFIAAHLADGTMPDTGVVIASGGNAGLACAWAARRHGVKATVFVPETTPRPKIARMLDYGADLRRVGREYAEAAHASEAFAATTGALRSHAYDNSLIAAGAGTLMLEIIEAAGNGLDTVVVSVGGAGLLAGLTTVAAAHGILVVAVEPEGAQTFHAAQAAGMPVDVPVHSIAADSLGARRITPLALAASDHIRSVLVTDDAIIRARQHLWDTYRIAVEHAAGTAVAAVLTGTYVPREGERVVIILCGANTDPSDLVAS